MIAQQLAALISLVQASFGACAGFPLGAPSQCLVLLFSWEMVPIFSRTEWLGFASRGFLAFIKVGSKREIEGSCGQKELLRELYAVPDPSPPGINICNR